MTRAIGINMFGPHPHTQESTMIKEQITPPGIYSTETLKYAHGIKVGNVLYTSGVVAWGPDGGIVGEGDVEAQAHRVYQTLEAILNEAGATWNDVVKYNAYLANPEDRQKAREVHFQYMPYYQRAGATVSMPLVLPELLIEVDVIAYIGQPKVCVSNVPETFVPLGSPHSVRVGDTIYVTGQQPIAGRQPVMSGGRLGNVASHEGETIGKGDFVAQADAVYRNFDNILRANGAGWDNVVWSHGYVTRHDVIEDYRNVRYRYHSPGQVAATSVVCSLVGREWMIEAEIIASMAPRESFTVPGVSVSPGVAHAVRAGNTLYVQGQVGRNSRDETVGVGDIEAQAAQVYKNLDDILKGAGASWDNVVRTKSYIADRSYAVPIRAVRDRYLKPGAFTSTTVVAGFFKPEYMLEVEAVAVLD